MKKMFLICLIFSVFACSNNRISSNDVGECRELAYEQRGTHSDASIQYKYNQCILMQKKAKDKKNKEDDIKSFLDIIFDIIYSSLED
jgi:hypothetical protein